MARLKALVAAAAALSAVASANPLFASFDGSQNNLLAPSRGSKEARFSRRLGLAFYADGVSSVDETLPAPRTVSNVLFGQPPFRYNS